MEPVTTLTAILIAGATAAAKGIASEGGKECYKALKSKISDWFGSHQAPEGEMALARIENDAETWAKPLEKSLAETNAEGNAEIMELARLLHEAIQNSPQTVEGLSKFNINMSNCKVGVIGDKVKINTINL